MDKATAYIFLVLFWGIALINAASICSTTNLRIRERCGYQFNNSICSDGSCCSKDGFCGGNQSDFCNIGCQSNCNSPLNKITQCSEPKTVALTYDDGPSDFTKGLLDVLLYHQVKATFFIYGEMIFGDREGLIPRMVREGHTVATHTFRHPDLTLRSDDQIREELRTNEELLVRLTGAKPKYFRPPYYMYDERISKIIDSFNYTTVFIGIDSYDYIYQGTDPEKIYKSIVNNLNGASPIIIQHDIHKSSVDLVDRIITNIKGQGYKLVNMENCLK